MTCGNSEIRPENGVATPEPDHGKTTTAGEAECRLEGDDEISTAPSATEAAFPPQQARPGATQTVPAIDDTGEWGSAPQIRAPRGFTCGGCPARWSTLRQAHCSGCHRLFTSVSGFDRHRTADGCAHPARVGLVERGDGLWSFPAPDPTQVDLSWRNR